jgi:hypothetical protein
MVTRLWRPESSSREGRCGVGLLVSVAVPGEENNVQEQQQDFGGRAVQWVSREEASMHKWTVTCLGGDD